MTVLVTELKTRARLRINALRREERARDSGEPKLKDCLNAVARDAGFANWDHARHVLSGNAAAGEDMGRLWHARGCDKLLNQWFAHPAEATVAQESDAGSFLLPYGRQFIVAQDDFVRELGLDPADPAWAAIRRNLVRGYASSAWMALGLQRLKAQAQGLI